MKNTTTCYIEKDGKYLMLHRVKKENDMNKDKWIGVGGKFEEGESPEECVIREVKEETGFYLKSINLRCIVTYVSNEYETEQMYVFTSTEFEGELIECNEGNLEWIDKEKITSLNIWEGDKIFIDKIHKGDSFFTVKVEYNGDELVEYKVNEY